MSRRRNDDSTPYFQLVFAGTLTTSNGQILDPSGNVVVLKGFALSGFEISLTMTGDLSEGTDSIAHDWDTIMYRCRPYLALCLACS